MARSSLQNRFCFETLEDRTTPATLPAGFTDTILVENLNSPSVIEIAKDGRIFLGEQTGKIQVFKNGQLLATPFLELSVDARGERGLLGITFDPNFKSNPFVYVHYTVSSGPAHNRVSRFTVTGDVADPSSEQILLEIDPLSTATNHNGGDIHFGLDGKLYVAVGDNANSANAQTLNNLLGKMLRINSDGTIPSDNPFSETTSGKNRAIWATGLRNPFTFAVQAGTGRIFINDVGQAAFEEINDGLAGANYGWPAHEGIANNPDFTDPLFAYPHGSGNEAGCAITGGAFYNPNTAQFPAEYIGDYFFTDFCNGWIRRYDPQTDTATEFVTGLPLLTVDLEVDAAGNLYYFNRGKGSPTSTVTTGGTLHRISFPAGQIGPGITQQPVSVSALTGDKATFSVTASGPGPLTYQWQRNGEAIPGADQATYTTPNLTLANNGDQYRVVVFNAFDSVTSEPASLTVTQAPTFSLDEPSILEGNSGQAILRFTLTLAPTRNDVSRVSFETRDDSARTSDGDYVAQSGTLEFAAGESTKNIDIVVLGDTKAEGNEKIRLRLSNPVGARIDVSEKKGMILNDEPIPVKFDDFTEPEDRVLGGEVSDNTGDVVLLNGSNDPAEDSIRILDPVTGAVLGTLRLADFDTWNDPSDRSLIGDVQGSSAGELIQINRPATSGGANNGAILRVLDLQTGAQLSQILANDLLAGQPASVALQQVLDPEDEVFLGHFTQTTNLEALFFNRTNQQSGATSLIVVDLVTRQIVDQGVHNGLNFGGWIDPSDEYVISDTNFDGLDDLVVINRVADPTQFRATAIGFVGMVSLAPNAGGRTGNNIGFYRFFDWNFAKPNEASVFPGYDELSDNASFGTIRDRGTDVAVITLINSQFDDNPAAAAFALLKPAPLQQGVRDSFQLVSTQFRANPSINSASFDIDDDFFMLDVNGDGIDELVSYSRGSGEYALRAYDGLTGALLGNVSGQAVGPGEASARRMQTLAPTSPSAGADSVAVPLAAQAVDQALSVNRLRRGAHTVLSENLDIF